MLIQTTSRLHPGGIEQGFTVTDPPPGTGQPLVVEMTSSGQLAPRLVDNGMAVALAGSGRR